MANLEIEGKIYRKLAPQSGTSARGTWGDPGVPMASGSLYAFAAMAIP